MPQAGYGGRACQDLRSAPAAVSEPGTRVAAGVRQKEGRVASSPRAKPERDSGIGSRLWEAAKRLLGFAVDAGPVSLGGVAAEAGVPGDEIVVVEEWVDAGEGSRGSLLGWYRTEAAEGRDPNVGPAPRPGGPRPGGPRPGGPRPGVRPSGPPAD